MSLVGQWDELQAGLPSGWRELRAELRIEERSQLDRAAAVLGPVQALEAADGTVRFRVVRQGPGPGPELARRLLGKLDSERLHGTLELEAPAEQAPAGAAAPAAQPVLAVQWEAALARLPADWSDLLAQLELGSSDWLDPAAVRLAPLNPRLEPGTLTLRFRAARVSGYGASAGMVRRCLERCDEAGIRGTVELVRVLSDTQHVQTQGPVWQLSGRTV
jgi:hypothetical protein